MSKTWRQESLEIIHVTFCDIRKAQPDVPRDQVLRMVSLHYYPFGERRGYPYQAWLLAMKDYRKTLHVDVGQVTGPLFDEVPARPDLFTHNENNDSVGRDK